MDISLHYTVAFRTFFLPLPSVKKTNTRKTRQEQNKTADKRSKHEQNNITQRSKVKRGEEFLVWRSNWETESQLPMRKVEEMENTCADNGWKAPKCCCRGHYIEICKKWDLGD